MTPSTRTGAPRWTRIVAIGLVSMVAALALGTTTACRTQAPSSEDEPKKPPRPATRTFTAEGVDFLEVYTNEAPDDAPIVVAIHGRGDSPAGFSALYKRYPGKVHLLVPRAFEPFGSGFSWFKLSENMTDEELGASVGASLTKLHAAVAKVVGAKRYVVTGFSQGGILSYGFASKYPSELSCALPLAGSLPGPLLPGPKVKVAKTRAFHGEADDVIASKWDKATVDTFAREGGDATLHTYPGLGHSTSPELVRDYFAELDTCVGALK